MSHRFFKAAPEAYQAARVQLDLAFGHPNARAETCMTATPVLDPEGNALVALPVAMTDWPEVEVAPLIATMLSEGHAGEITREQYDASLPIPQP